ncbi:MAG: FHA domain-containing protein, partial [Cyanobacteria bacterium Co-bin8]|nr:FHA domain-containing protein [Cyanobacteria bacterium Co-bin8]
HHGVPAVLAMRDSIADEEALSFIQAFAQALAERHPVEQAMALARQQLLTLYGFNKTPWTLPVLYMHPQFDGVILEAPRRDVTRLPGEEGQTKKFAAVRSVEDPARVWPIYGGLMHVGRLPDNDLVIPEPWVSGQHAEIFCRNVSVGGQTQATYFLRDRSRFGTYCYLEGIWQHIHQQEVALNLGAQLRFGSHEGRLLEFIIEGGGSRFS